MRFRGPASRPFLALSIAALAGCGGSNQTQGSGTGGSGSSSTAASSSSATTASSSTGTGGSGGSGGSGGGATVDSILSSLPQSCAFSCAACPEPETPFACPTLDAWDKLPHDAACDWDGKTYPPVTQGKCTVSAPTGDAAQPAGPLSGGGLVLPDGRRIQPAGVDYVFAEADLQGGYPMNVLPLTGTHFALVSDGGIQDNALRLVDVNALAAGSAPVASYTPFHEPTSIFWGLAWLPPSAALASGGGDGNVYAFDVDTTAGTLARAGSRDITVGTGDDGSPYYVGPVAVTPDGQKLVVAPSDHATELRIYSLGTSDYGTQLGTVTVGSKHVFDLEHDPFDTTGNLFYATDTAGGKLLEIDLSAGMVTRTIPLAKNPAQIVFLDATYAVVTEEDNDTLAVVDRAAGMVTSEVPILDDGRAARRRAERDRVRRDQRAALRHARGRQRDPGLRGRGRHAAHAHAHGPRADRVVAHGGDGGSGRLAGRDHRQGARHGHRRQAVHVGERGHHREDAREHPVRLERRARRTSRR